MIFSTNTFLFLFLPIFLSSYYLTPARHRSLTILIGSYIFYAWWRMDFLLLFAAVTCWNYLIGRKIHESIHHAKRWLAVGVTLNLFVLGYFKYANFGADTVNAVLTSVGSDPWLVSNVILPIGISFYIFQAISYLVDVYRKDAPVSTNFIQFAAFIALFPQLIAGPVLRYKDVVDQFSDRTHSFDKFSEGAERFMVGFIKKVIIADSLAPLVEAGFSIAEPSATDAWLATIAYTAQLYFDFSGYADMAIGLGLMMGFRFVENFNQPYVSQSITEFWRRWHISLSNWLRDYLYIPLGGNRGGEFNNYRNLLLTMLLGGLWHGSNWTFLIWGAWHGGLLAIEKYFNLAPTNKSFNVLRWLLTLSLVMLGWIVFRAETLESAASIYLALVNVNDLQLSPQLASVTTGTSMLMLSISWLIIIVRGLHSRNQSTPISLINSLRIATVPMFVLGILKLSAQSYSPFLYFQF